MPSRNNIYLRKSVWYILFITLLTACSTRTPAAIPLKVIDTETPKSTVAVVPTNTLNPPTLASTKTPIAPILTTSPLPCQEDICVFPGHFIFHTPIGSDFNQNIEPSYLYGSTQENTREPHHGVEFINPQGTPVLAAGDGTVVFAGNDSNVEIGWWVNFYGNLVVIQHSVDGFDDPIFTLYGHLSKIHARTGDIVKVGDKIGEVGMTGKALGTHLHFEVREGINDYAHTRNPELWLIPEKGNGALVGQIFNEDGETRRYNDLQLLSLDHPEMKFRRPVPYADAGLNGDDTFMEVFAVGNLPSGKYELHFSPNGKPKIVPFEINTDSVTRITFHTQY